MQLPLSASAISKLLNEVKKLKLPWPSMLSYSNSIIQWMQSVILATSAASSASDNAKGQAGLGENALVISYLAHDVSWFTTGQPLWTQTEAISHKQTLLQLLIFYNFQFELRWIHRYPTYDALEPTNTRPTSTQKDWQLSEACVDFQTDGFVLLFVCQTWLWNKLSKIIYELRQYEK